MFIREIWEKFASFIFTREISKFQKSELGKFIPNFPLKHVITSTNIAPHSNVLKENLSTMGENKKKMGNINKYRTVEIGEN